MVEVLILLLGGAVIGGLMVWLGTVGLRARLEEARHHAVKLQSRYDNAWDELQMERARRVVSETRMAERQE
jgi:hypothetical protein